MAADAALLASPLGTDSASDMGVSTALRVCCRLLNCPWMLAMSHATRLSMPSEETLEEIAPIDDPLVW